MVVGRVFHPGDSLLRDNYGRFIDYLRLSVTDRCNLRCRYCMPEEGVPSLGHGRVLSYEELFRVAAVAVRLGVSKIRVTGGEPLVRKGIVDFVRSLTSLLQKPEVTLTTNGLFLAEMVDDLKAAGLSRVNVSLDTLKSERFEAITRRSGLEKVLQGIAAVEKAGLAPIKVNMVPIGGVNDDEIADFARLSLTRGWEVRFIEFMPVSGGLDYTPEQRVSFADILAVLESLGPLETVERKGVLGPARLFRYAGAPGRLGVIPAVSHHFCGECNRLRLTSDGKLRPCLLDEREIDIRDILRNGGDDALLEQVLLEAVGGKPERHRVGEDDFRQGDRKMQGIGG